MTTLRGRPKQPKPEDLLDSMPRGASEHILEHILEAMQGALPELEKLADYERRAAARPRPSGPAARRFKVMV